MKTLIRNGRIITPEGIEEGFVLLKDGKIEQVGIGLKAKIADVLPADDVTEIDAAGCYVAPGFIDMHTHGAGGADWTYGNHYRCRI